MPKKKQNKALTKTELNLKQRVYLRLYLLISFYAQDFKEQLIQNLEVLKKGLSQETEQTKEMLEIYFKQTQRIATREEVKRANKQFRDIIRSLGLGVILVLPFSPIALPLIVKLGRKLGVEVLPDSFIQKDD